MTSRQQYTTTQRKRLEAVRAAQLEQSLRDQAAMTLEAFVALKLEQAAPAADCQAQTLVWVTARHAELVNLYS